MNSIDEMAESFKTLKELRQYCHSQFVLINSLNQKNNELESENKHLKELLEKASPILQEVEGKLEIYKNLSDEMAVCLMQIKVLKDKSIGTELTLEEAKKLDIYTKLLISLKSKEAAKDSPAKQLSDAELINLIEQQENK